LNSIVWGNYPKVSKVICAYDNCNQEFIKFFEEKFPFTISLPFFGERRLNFTKNANRGLRFAFENFQDSSGFLCCNMDVCLPACSTIEKTFNSGLSTCTAEHFDGSAWNKVTLMNQKNSPGCPCNKTIDQGIPQNSTKFACFCTWMSKETIKKIGFFDEKTFYSSFEDDDLIIRAVLEGIPVQQFPIRVHHELKNRDPSKGESISTTGSYSLNDLGISMQLFMRKWNIPNTTPHDQFCQYILDNWKGSPPTYCP
jgi:hypothetical protein